MKSIIHLLASDLVNKIAAGEVIERPASILKELLENAIDAGADEINITLEKGGLDSISISDNGTGMNKVDVNKALQQHATSKIQSESDLFNINTLGFRGEALASIASICDLSIHTFNGIDDPVTLTAYQNKIVTKQGPGRVKGTTIKASRIFAYIPARRKFLKTEQTEYRYIQDAFINIALAYPNIRFKLIRNEKLVYDLIKTKDVLTRIISIFPNFKPQDLISISYDEPGYLISGFVAAPKLSSVAAAKQYFFLNNRYIKNALLNKAVKEGFASAIMQHENPSYFIFLHFNNSSFDVNVHPRKLEVRFEDPGKIFKIVKNAVKFTIEKTSQNQLKERFSTIPKSLSEVKPVPRAASKTNNAAMEFINYQSPKAESVISSLDFTKGLLEQVNLEVKDKETFTKDIEIGSHEFLQLFNTYIVTSNQESMIVIDQHAAHERITFERIKTNISRGTELETQDLLIPEKLSLTETDRLILKEKLQVLNIIGFHFKDIEQGSALLISIPAILPISNINTTLRAVFNEFNDDTQQESNAWDKINDKIISTMACHSSIRAGQRLNNEAITQLLKDLGKCKLPYSCPHGRPIVWEISRMEIEKKFKRIV